jgi:three-Cys-motif partner protein
MLKRNCSEDNCKNSDGNCLVNSSEDNLPIQCVGPWVENKYYFLEMYLNASCEARKKFSDKGNAVFIDLFSGSGKCIIKNEKREIDSGGIRALKRDRAPFNSLFYFDINKANIDALTKRLAIKSNCHITEGDSNTLVNELTKRLPKQPYKYHFAFIDPFGPSGLKFITLKALAELKRMDMLIHFPIGAIKRNLKTWLNKENTILDDFLGTTKWREKIKTGTASEEYKILIDVFKDQLKSIGYPEEGLKMASSDKNIYTGLPTVPIKNTQEGNLYVLILASKNQLGQKIWNSVINISPNGQKTFKFS